MKKDYNRNNSGITLIALIITIVIMLIIAGVSINIGTNSLNSTRLNGFYMQLEIVQKRVDDIAATNESYVDANGEIKYLKESGNVLTGVQKSNLEVILSAEGFSNDKISQIIDNFRYFTVAELENVLGIREVKYNMFIDFKDRIVVAEQGITLDGKTYYTLEDTTYFVEHIDKNAGEEGKIEKLNYSVPIEYGEEKYKISITQEKPIGDLDGTGTIKYKKTTSKYWETTIDTEIIVEFDTKYNIKFIDLNNNSIERVIKVEYKRDETTGDILKDDEGNNILTVTEVVQEESEEI